MSAIVQDEDFTTLRLTLDDVALVAERVRDRLCTCRNYDTAHSSKQICYTIHLIYVNVGYRLTEQSW